MGLAFKRVAVAEAAATTRAATSRLAAQAQESAVSHTLGVIP